MQCCLTDLSSLRAADVRENIVDGIQQKSYRTSNVPAAHKNLTSMNDLPDFWFVAQSGVLARTTFLHPALTCAANLTTTVHEAC